MKSPRRTMTAHEQPLSRVPWACRPPLWREPVVRPIDRRRARLKRALVKAALSLVLLAAFSAYLHMRGLL